MERRWTGPPLDCKLYGARSDIECRLHAVHFLPVFQEDWDWPIDQGQLALVEIRGFMPISAVIWTTLLCVRQLATWRGHALEALPKLAEGASSSWRNSDSRS